MYHGSKHTQQMLQSSLENARAAERSNETRRINDEMNAKISRLDVIVCALWQIMKENGIPEETLFKKIDELLDSRQTEFSSIQIVKCPKCGKNVQESYMTPMRGRCVYCGDMITFYPFSDEIKSEETGERFDPGAKDEDAQGDAPADTAEEKPYDVSDDLGF